MEKLLIPILVAVGGVFIWSCFTLMLVFILIRFGTMMYMLKSGKAIPIARFIWHMNASIPTRPLPPPTPDDTHSV